MLRILQQLVLTTLFAVFASQASAMFIQSDWFDPTQPGVGTNRYAYSFNDPVNLMDPSGNAAQRGGPDDGLRSEGTTGSLGDRSATDIARQNDVDPGDSDMVGAIHGSVLGDVTGINGVIDAVNGAMEGSLSDVATGAAQIATGKLKVAKRVAEEAAERAKELHKILDSRAQRARTTAVTETKEGTRIISSSERRLTPAQRAQLRQNEVEGVGVGHAEVTGVNAATNMGLTPTGTAASRPICSNCASFLKNRGVDPLSPLK